MFFRVISQTLRHGSNVFYVNLGEHIYELHFMNILLLLLLGKRHRVVVMHFKKITTRSLQPHIHSK